MPNKPKKSYETLWLEELMAFSEQSEILKKWEPVSFIDKGTFSRIFKVVNRETGEPAALKMIPNPMEVSDCREAGSAYDEYYRTRFEASKREAEIMTRFHGDQNVVQYLEKPEYLCRSFQGEQGEVLLQYAVLICMPLYTNHKHWGPLISEDREKKIQLGMDIAKALVRFEEEGVFHRDIKPGNVLMDAAGVFCLSDVGEAKLESEFTTIGFHGTRPYMAPEVYKQENERTKMRSDHRSDIYSLGMILYRLFNKHQFPFLTESGTLTEEATVSYRQYVKKYQLSGDALFTDSERARLLRYDGKKLPPPAYADKQLSKVILRACAYNKKDRYQRAQDLYDALAGCLAGEAPVELQRKTRRTGISNVLLGISAAVVGLSIAVLSFMLGRSSNQPVQPTVVPSATETAVVSITAVPSPTPEPTSTPSLVPTATPKPTSTPSPMPTASPEPTEEPTKAPTAEPTEAPTEAPTAEPTEAPTEAPTATPKPTSTPSPASGLPVYQPGDEVELNGLCFVLANDGTWEVFGTSAQKSVVIPSQVDGIPVTRIGNSAFAHWSSMRSIEIPESIVSMGEYAFYFCIGLENISLPEGITHIPDYAFAHCSFMNSIDIPASITSIGENSFLYCSELESIVLPEGISEIPRSAFEFCGNLKTLVVPDSVSSIEEYAFYHCSSLQSITLPEGITHIPASAFYDCSSLQTIKFPNTLTSIGSEAFCGCSSLQSIDLPNSVTSIGAGVFSGCTALHSVKLTDSLTFIGAKAFAACSSL